MARESHHLAWAELQAPGWLRALTEQAPVGLFATHSSGELLFANEVWRRLAGVGSAWQTGDRTPIHPADRAQVCAAWERAIAQQAPFHAEFRFLHPDGRAVWVLAQARPVEGDGAAEAVYVGTLTDIGEDKRVKALLSDAELKLGAIVGHTSDSIYLKDLTGRHIFTNQAAADNLGLAQDQVLGRTDQELFEAETFARIQAEDQALLASRRPVTLERKIVTKGGLERIYSSTKYVYCDGAGQPVGIIGIARDVTARVALEHELRLQYDRLKELDVAKSQFVEAVSHDLRTPLTSIRGYAEFLTEELGGPLTPTQRDFIGQILSGSQRMEHLVDDMMDFARLDAGSFKLDLHHRDLGALIAHVVESLQPQILSARVKLALDVPAQPVSVKLDAARIERVLNNLINNALKFTPNDGTVSVRLESADAWVRCEIGDTGLGIPEDDIPKLFQRFQQLSEGMRKGGTGLGLSISMALVAAHGGEIGVDSVPGQGSTFWFTLPL